MFLTKININDKFKFVQGMIFKPAEISILAGLKFSLFQLVNNNPIWKINI